MVMGLEKKVQIVRRTVSFIDKTLPLAFKKSIEVTCGRTIFITCDHIFHLHPFGREREWELGEGETFS